MVEDGNGSSSRRLRQARVPDRRRGRRLGGGAARSTTSALARGRRLPDGRGRQVRPRRLLRHSRRTRRSRCGRASPGSSASSKLHARGRHGQDFKHVVEHTHGHRPTTSGDFTVHARISGLKPGARVLLPLRDEEDKHSRVGRFRTLPPADSKQPLKIGLLLLPETTRPATTTRTPRWRRRTTRPRPLPRRLHLRAPLLRRARRPRRTRPAEQGRRRPDAGRVPPEVPLLPVRQATCRTCRRRYPFVSVWDDHEVEDNYAGDGAGLRSRPIPTLREQRNDPAAGAVRQAAQERLQGVLRGDAADPASRATRTGIYGSIRLGGMAELFLTDQRQYRDRSRATTPCSTPCPDDRHAGPDVARQPAEGWFKKAVPASKAQWKLWAAR